MGQVNPGMLVKFCQEVFHTKICYGRPRSRLFPECFSSAGGAAPLSLFLIIESIGLRR